jgi:hypothetical protein
MGPHFAVWTTVHQAAAGRARPGPLDGPENVLRGPSEKLTHALDKKPHGFDAGSETGNELPKGRRFNRRMEAWGASEREA